MATDPVAATGTTTTVPANRDRDNLGPANGKQLKVFSTTTLLVHTLVMAITLGVSAASTIQRTGPMANLPVFSPIL
jgi:hypothetical protein